MITTETVKLNLPLPTDDEAIEKELKELGIDPLRWAIVKVDGQELTLTVSFEKA